MTDIEELKHVLEVLTKYDLPVSPILEYAIKEKIESLSSVEERPFAVPELTVKEKKEIAEVSISPAVGKKKKASILRIFRSDGTVIEGEKASYSFSMAISEIGVKRVYSLKIPMDGMYLVTRGGNPQYPNAQHNVGNGYFVNVHSNTVTKKRQLERIFTAFNLSWRVEIIETE